MTPVTRTIHQKIVELAVLPALLTLLCLLALYPLAAQTPIPSGYVQTTATVPALTNGSFSAAWTNLSSSPQLGLLGCVSTFQTTVTGQIDSYGRFTTLLADTAQICPAPSTWTFTFVCPPANPGSFQIQIPITGGGGTENISAAVTSALPTNFCAGGGGSGQQVVTSLLGSVNNVINIMAPPYNAQCNLAKYSGGAISAGATTLTNNSIPVGLPVGTKVIIWGAGALQSNGDYGPTIATSTAVSTAGSITFTPATTTALPNFANLNNRFEIGADDTVPVQTAYNAAAQKNFALLIPAPPVKGNSCLSGAIDMSAGGTISFNVPIAGQGNAVSSITGMPGQDIFQWPDNRVFSIGLNFPYMRDLTLWLDTSIDSSCPNWATNPSGCPSVGNGQTSWGRVSGYAPITAKSFSTWAVSSGTLTITLSPALTTAIPVGSILSFKGCTQGLTSLNYASASHNVYTVTSPTSTTQISIAAGSLTGAGTNETCQFSGLQSQTPPIAPGPVVFSNGAMPSDGGIYDEFTGTGFFTEIPPWIVIGTYIYLPQIAYAGTINSVISNTEVQFTPGTACPSSLCAPLTATAYSVSAGVITLTTGTNTYPTAGGTPIVIAQTNSGDPLFAFNGQKFTTTAATSNSVSFAESTVTGSGSTTGTTVSLGALEAEWGTGSPTAPVGLTSPPWYVGNAGIAIPASNGATTGAISEVFSDIVIDPITVSNQAENHAASAFFQQAPNGSIFTNFTSHTMAYCYVEAINVANNSVVWSPDTSQYKNFNCNTQVDPIQYGGNHRIFDGLGLFSGDFPFSIGPFFLNAPLNPTGGSTITHFYHETWFNSGEISRFQGGNWVVNGGSLTQGAGTFVWQASNSVVNASEIVGNPPTGYPNYTPGLNILGATNIFNNLNIVSAGPDGTYGSQISDLGAGNYVSIGSGTSIPTVTNNALCSPGMANFEFLSGRTLSPYGSQCTMAWTSINLLPSSNVGVYTPSTAGDGNPLPGWLDFSATVTSITFRSAAKMMVIGTSVPIGAMNVVFGGSIGSGPNSFSFRILDLNTNTALATCTYANVGTTFAIYGQVGSPSPCVLTTTSAESGHVIQLQTTTNVSSVGGLNFSFVALVPQQTDPLEAPVLLSSGTAQTAANITASTGWGTSGAAGNGISAVSGSQRFKFTITAAGTPTANPTFTATLPVTFPSAPLCTAQQVGGTGASGVIQSGTATATSTGTMTWVGTPAAASTYIIVVDCR